MIASLQGALTHKDASGAVVECGGVGYAVAMSLTSLARLGRDGSEVRLLVHTHLSQDALRLYGFCDEAERDAFRVLIGTSGVGPKLALAILSTMAPGELAAVIAQRDKAALTRIPGVGGKKAERLLVELKDRLPAAAFAATAPGARAVHADLLSALTNLGFADDVAEGAARAALEQHPDEPELATLVRAALRLTR